MRHFEGLRTVVPTGAGLRPTRMAEELYVQAGTEAKAFSFADIDKPLGSRGESFTIDAFGHEEDLVERDRGQAGEEVFDFGQIVFG